MQNWNCKREQEQPKTRTNKTNAQENMKERKREALILYYCGFAYSSIHSTQRNWHEIGCLMPNTNNYSVAAAAAAPDSGTREKRVDSTRHDTKRYVIWWIVLGPISAAVAIFCLFSAETIEIQVLLVSWPVIVVSVCLSVCAGGGGCVFWAATLNLVQVFLGNK